MLHLIHIWPLSFVNPLIFACCERHSSEAELAAGAFGAEEGRGVVIRAVRDLTAAEELAHAVRVFVIYLEMVVIISAFRRDLTTAHCDCLQRWYIAHGPAH